MNEEFSSVKIMLKASIFLVVLIKYYTFAHVINKAIKNMDLYEKQGEPANKVKPKFKVGDWVINKLGDLWHIDSFDKKNYQVSDGKGNYNYFPISKQDEMRLWSEVDLEKEIKNRIDSLSNLYCYMEDLFNGNEEEGVYPIPEKVKNELFEFAKHFFELGLKAKSGTNKK